MRFRRILFRITRGMTWTVLIDIEDNHQNGSMNHNKTNPRPKTVFLIVYQVGERDMLKDKLKRICDSFGASQYFLLYKVF